MSADPGTRHHDLLTALRGGPAATPAPTWPPAPAAVTLLPAAATSRHQLAVDAALAGGPLVVDTGSGTGSEGAVLLTGLLAALAAAGRRVTLVPGTATQAARGELTRLGLGHLLADTPEDPSRRGADLPPADPNRWLTVLRDLDTRHRAWFGGDGTGDGTGNSGSGAPSRSDALAGLAALRAEHLHPPLLPAAATWTTQDRARVVDLLGRGTAAGDDPLRGADDERVAAAADALDALPATLDRLPGLLARLGAEVRWRSPRTLADVEAAPALLARVDQALRTYVPSALHTDLDHAAAILARQPRSLLSAEERERRRELKRLSSLRHDGAGFGSGDVQALTELHRAWAERADGTPTASFSGRDELTAALEAVRRDLPVVAAVLPGVPADPEVAALPELADRVRRAAAAARARRDRAAVAAEGLEDLVAAVPAGSGPDEVARLVEGTTWRALVEAPDPGGVPVQRLVEEFGRLDEQRRARAARELQLALSGARARAVAVTAEPAGDVDVLVVDDAHRLDAGRVAGFAASARQVVLLGTSSPDPGSAWERAAAAVGVLTLDLPRRQSAVREAVAAAVSAAGPSVEPSVGPGPGTDLVLRADGAELLVDVEDSLALLRVQDREVALPARHRAAGAAYRLLRVADWFTDPRGSTRALVEDLRAVRPAEPVAAAVPVPAPVAAEAFPKGLGSADDAHRTVAEFVTALAGGNPNIDQTPAATVDAAVALAYADLGVQAADAAVLDAAMELLTYRRRGAKVLRAFKESLQRSKKKMRGAGVKIS